MLLTLITIILGCVCAWFYMRWLRVKQFWAQRNVPHEPPNPILGSLSVMLTAVAAEWMRRLYQNSRGPYTGIWLLWQPTLVVNCPEIARRVLVKDADVFRDRFAGSGKHDPIGGLNLFTVNDPIWTSIRRRLSPVFTSAKLRKVEELGTMKATELMQRFNNDMKQGRLSNLRTVFTDYTTDIIGTAAFGIAGDATLTGESVLRQVTKDFSKFTLFRGIGMSSIFFMPSIVDFFGFTFFPKATTEFFRKIFHAAVMQRGGFDNRITETRDLLDALIKMKQDAAADNEEMREDLLVAQAAIFLQAGFNTSALNLTYATYEMAYSPLVQEKLYQELLDAKLKHDNLNSEVLSQLKYLNCVIKETLRKYPPVAYLDRVPATDYKIDENLIIPAKTPVYVNIIGPHYDPDIFPDPEDFNPDRFLPVNKDNIKPFTFMPFGEGPRGCIGVRFAYQNIRFALSSLILNFELRPLPNFPHPSKVKVDRNSFGRAPGEQLSVEFVPRNI